MKAKLTLTTAAACLAASVCYAEDRAVPGWELSGLVGATSDYVYRGVSLRDEKPSPFLSFDVRYGIFYANGFLVGTYLGEDALGRDLGNLEADATVGLTARFGKVDFNIGVKYTGYPNGRDLIIGTLDAAERDFVEPFAGAAVNLTDRLSIGGTIFWTPDFYYESGTVVTVEGQLALVFPEWNGVTSKFNGTLGNVHSEQADVAAPGKGYIYWNAGLEARVERLIFDLRYWDTDVDSVDEFGRRFVFSMGVAIN